MSPDTDTIRSAAADAARRSWASCPPLAVHPFLRSGAGSYLAASLFERLGRAGRVTQVSAPAGSGKTFLLRSWIDAAGLTGSTPPGCRCRTTSAIRSGSGSRCSSALQQTAAGSVAGAALDRGTRSGWLGGRRAIAQADLESLQDRAWLVIDDVHELRSAEVLRQLELLLMRGPPELRFVLATRHDLRLGSASPAAGRRADRDPRGQPPVHPR